jgi:cell division protein FtsW
MPKPKSLDYLFLFAVIALCAVGLTMVFSASPTMAMKYGDTLYFVKRQFFYLALGFAALYYAYRLDLDNLKSKAVPVMISAVALLIAVFVPGVGRKVLGASRWIDLGILSFQPSELIKFAMVLFMAKWLADRKGQIADLVKGFLPPLLWLGLVSVLIMKQPDMGTNLAIAGTFFVMLFVAGANLWHLGGLGLLGISAVAALSITEPYRLRRLLAYLDPWQDPQGIGFHIIQSLLAVGSGGLLGLGLGASRQKFFYLPQQFTDFIFAILCEELGFLGGGAVVGLFVLFTARGFQIALATRDDFKRYLAVGLVSWLAIQALINIMVVLGIIPTTGIPLPFISYGGTATIINLFAVGVVLNVSRKP